MIRRGGTLIATASRFWLTPSGDLFGRVESGKQIVDPHPTVIEAIATHTPQRWRPLRRCASLLEVGLSTTLTPDETAYLAVHVARLVEGARRRPVILRAAAPRRATPTDVGLRAGASPQ